MKLGKFETKGGIPGTEGVQNGVGSERKGERNRRKNVVEVIKKKKEGRKKRGEREKRRKGEFI